ncbi:Putative MarR-family transcriptional regulator (fragment) [Nostocoides japonicum T1-X7]|uniref:Putative MarR-family transcriptional regulator n=1 Tax=Nostocoides japonicum T1-X7 TaxID=1194083 RepID=A0A077LVX9_9MICO
MANDGSDTTPWLTPQERRAWLSIAALIVKLPNALDAQLQSDSGIGFFDYMVLAVLSEEPRRTLQLSDIAAATSASLSRLSHTVTRLERQGLVRRERIPGPGRRTNAVLTDEGYAKVVAAAPAHVRRVRDLVIDALTPTQLRTLGTVGARVIERIDPGRSCSDD